MEIRLLGAVEVVGESGLVRLGSVKQRALLAVLALSPNRPVTRTGLVDALWGEAPPADGSAALRYHVSQLRRALAPVGGRIVTTGGGYALEVDEGALDLDHFESLADAGARRARDDPAGAADLYGRALALWRGPPLADLADEPFAAPEIARLCELRRGVLQRWATVALEAGDHRLALAELERLVEAEPFDESWWALLMLALYRSGRHADALDAFQRARHVLGEELGIEPSGVLRDLEARILRHDPDLRLHRDPDPSSRASPDTVGSSVESISRTGALPEQLTSFVGREGDLETLAALLTSRRLVTLTGVGGVGKTRLAVEVARKVAGHFSDGTYFVDLSAVSEGTWVPARLADALGAALPARRAPPGLLDDALGSLAAKRVLVVLDNCEHLLDASAEVAGRLLRSCPGVVVLATSREALSLDGEQVWPVESLSLPSPELPDDSEAMRLLLTRVQSVEPRFTIDGTSRPALIDICLDLDGNPLALELAAARFSHLAPQEIAERLADRFALLKGGRLRPRRHQTLQQTVDWSYQLLAPEERSALRRLGVFAGGFTLDAAAFVAVSDIDAAAVDVIGSLVDKSLVIAMAGRYQLLETIRLYARARLEEAGEADAARSLHRDWFLARLEAESLDRCLIGDELGVELLPDIENLRTAAAWTFEQGRADLLRRMLLRLPGSLAWFASFPEFHDWSRMALDYELTLSPADRHFHVREAARGAGLLWMGDVAATEEALLRLEALTRHLAADMPITAYAFLQQAAHLSVFPRRAADIERAAELAIQHAGDHSPLIAVQGLWRKAVALLYQHRYDEAARLYEALQPNLEWEYGSALAVVRHLQGRHDEALALIDLERPRSYGAFARYERITTAASLAALGQHTLARRHLEHLARSTRSDPPSASPLALSDCLVGFAALAELEGDHRRASRLLATIPAMATDIPELFVLARHYRDSARTHLDPDTRRRCIEEGRATPVEEAIDCELARSGMPPPRPASRPGWQAQPAAAHLTSQADLPRDDWPRSPAEG